MHMIQKPRLSVIIPTLNEELAISEVLDQLSKSLENSDEIIIVDGGSKDSTVEVAQAYNVQVLFSETPGRAAQLDLGARQACGDYLCFLHADTITSDDLKAQIHRVLSENGVVLAGFVSIMRGKRSRWLISFLNYTKTYVCPFFYRPYDFFFKGLRLLFGDQVMFCRRSDYIKSGGFNPQTKIMEEAELCLSMNKLGRIKQFHQRVYSSDRRVAKLGLFKAMRIYIYIALGWAFGMSTEKLNARYEHIR